MWIVKRVSYHTGSEPKKCGTFKEMYILSGLDKRLEWSELTVRTTVTKATGSISCTRSTSLQRVWKSVARKNIMDVPYGARSERFNLYKCFSWQPEHIELSSGRRPSHLLGESAKKGKLKAKTNRAEDVRYYLSPNNIEAESIECEKLPPFQCGLANVSMC